MVFYENCDEIYEYCQHYENELNKEASEDFSEDLALCSQVYIEVFQPLC